MLFIAIEGVEAKVLSSSGPGPGQIFASKVWSMHVPGLVVKTEFKFNS